MGYKVPQMLIGIWLCLLWVANALRSEDDLQSNCYNFPKDDFSNANCITQKYGFTPKVVAVESNEAVDFTLKTPTVSDLEFRVCILWSFAISLVSE